MTAGSGTLHELNGTGLVSLEAHDVIRPLKAKTVEQEYASMPSVDVLTDVMDRTGLKAVSQGGGEIGQPGYTIDVGLETDPMDGGENEQFYTHKNFNDTDCLDAIDAVCRDRGWYWYVDEENIFWVVD